MSFINKCSTIIRRSDKEIFKFYIDNIIKIDHYDKDNNLIIVDAAPIYKQDEQTVLDNNQIDLKIE